MPACVRSQESCTVGGHQQARLQAAAVRKRQLRRHQRRRLTDSQAAGASTVRSGCVRNARHRAASSIAILDDRGQARHARFVGARRRFGRRRHRRTPPSRERPRCVRAPPPATRRRPRRNASLPGLMAYTRTSQPSGRSAGGGAARRDRPARGCSPLSASAQARLRPTSPPPTIATSKSACVGQCNLCRDARASQPPPEVDSGSAGRYSRSSVPLVRAPLSALP